MSGQFKVVIAGNKDSGKSSLLIRFVDDLYSSSKPSERYTDRAEGFVKTLNIRGSECPLRIWEKTASADQRVLRQCDGILLVVDSTDRSSFDGLNDLISQAEREMSRATVVIVALTKSDDESHRVVDVTEFQEFCEEHSLLSEIVSAQTGENIEKLFTNFSYAMQARKIDSRAAVFSMQKEAVKSSLEPRAAFTDALNAHADVLAAEIISTLACRRGLKQQKIDALRALAASVSREDRLPMRTLITAARTAHPFLDKGLVSHRTRDLLDQYVLSSR